MVDVVFASLRRVLYAFADDEADGGIAKEDDHGAGCTRTPLIIFFCESIVKR